MMVSKLLSSVLDKVSEDNNSYRAKLRNLNKSIDEKTTALVGDIVTLSNYTVDFSNAVTIAKDKLVNPISRIIESYVIRDLRSVETVNEQFVDKINDKIDGANISTLEEKDNFIQNLNSLLNDKYLEIVKIKRVDFLNDAGINDDVETAVNDFVSYLKTSSNFDDEKLEEVMTSYKKNLYDDISVTLTDISKLYLDNFVSEITGTLNMSLDTGDSSADSYSNDDSFKPYIPDIKSAFETEIPPVPDIPVIGDIAVPEVSEIDDINEVVQGDIPPVPEVPIIEEENKATVMGIPPIAPIEIVEDKKEEVKKTYDVEEILKIAKSPVVTMPVEEKKSENEYLSVTPITTKEENDTFDSEFDEKEIVEEMIARLTKRLEAINERQEKYEEEKRKLEDDESFVNDLINSSNTKREELDRFEEELNNKEKEIEEKQRELDKKINDVMPFADAVMKSSSEEA